MQSEVTDTHTPFLIIKNEQNDYRINFVYFFIQLYTFRWYLGSLIVIPTLIAYFITQYFTPVYKVTSILGSASQYVLKNVSDFAVKIAPHSNSNQDFKFEWQKGQSLSIQMHKKKETLDLKSLDDALFAQFNSRLKNPGNITLFLKESGIYQRELQHYPKASKLFKIKLMSQLINSFEVYPYSSERIEFDTTSNNPEQAIKDHVAYIEFTKNTVLDEFKRNTNRKIAWLKTQIASIPTNEMSLPSDEKASDASPNVIHSDKLLQLKEIESFLNFDASDLQIVDKEGSPFVNEIALARKSKYTLLMGFSIGLLLSLLLVFMKSNIIESKVINKKSR